MIDGVQQIPLKQIVDERGKVMHMLKSTDSYFDKFGEIYFSWINPGFAKAWYQHREMTLNYAVPWGEIKVVIFDDRLESPTHGAVKEYRLSPDKYTLLIIPPKVWYGFKAIGTTPAMVANCTTLPHDPKETIRLDPFDPTVPYSWGV